MLRWEKNRADYFAWLAIKQSEKDKVSQLVIGESERVVSCLSGEKSKLASSMKRAILEVIVSGAATSVIDVERYANYPLLAAQLNTTPTPHPIARN